jgi:transcriptional regulator with XRE-family HTH domain
VPATSAPTARQLLRKALKLSQKGFLQSILISKSFLSEIELENRKVNPKLIELASQKFNANPEWLKTGAGEMFSAPPPDVKLMELVEIFKNLNVHFQNYTLGHIRKLVRIQEAELDENTASAPQSPEIEQNPE